MSTYLSFKIFFRIVSGTFCPTKLQKMANCLMNVHCSPCRTLPWGLTVWRWGVWWVRGWWGWWSGRWCWLWSPTALWQRRFCAATFLVIFTSFFCGDWQLWWRELPVSWARLATWWFVSCSNCPILVEVEGTGSVVGSCGWKQEAALPKLWPSGQVWHNLLVHRLCFGCYPLELGCPYSRDLHFFTGPQKGSRHI